MRKWFLALALIAVPLAFSATALAAPPTTEVTVVVDSVTVDEDICADFGFDVTFVENGTFKTKTYYDSEGNIGQDHPHELQREIHLHCVGERKDAPHQLPTRFHHLRAMGTSGLDSATPTTFQGAGVVLLDAGRLILDIETGDVVFEAGQHELLNGSVDAFCGYFAS